MTNMTASDDFVDLVGLVAAREFNNADDRHKPGLIEWAQKLPRLTDAEFLDVAGRAIYDSASVNRFRGNWDHEHFKASACYTEATRRHVGAGHTSDCRGETLYDRAHARVMRDHGYQPGASTSCTCGQG